MLSDWKPDIFIAVVCRSRKRKQKESAEGMKAVGREDGNRIFRSASRVAAPGSSDRNQQEPETRRPSLSLVSSHLGELITGKPVKNNRKPRNRCRNSSLNRDVSLVCPRSRTQHLTWSSRWKPSIKPRRSRAAVMLGARTADESGRSDGRRKLGRWMSRLGNCPPSPSSVPAVSLPSVS